MGPHFARRVPSGKLPKSDVSGSPHLPAPSPSPFRLGAAALASLGCPRHVLPGHDARSCRASEAPRRRPSTTRTATRSPSAPRPSPTPASPRSRHCVTPTPSTTHHSPRHTPASTSGTFQPSLCPTHLLHSRPPSPVPPPSTTPFSASGPVSQTHPRNTP